MSTVTELPVGTLFSVTATLALRVGAIRWLVPRKATVPIVALGGGGCGTGVAGAGAGAGAAGTGAVTPAIGAASRGGLAPASIGGTPASATPASIWRADRKS